MTEGETEEEQKKLEFNFPLLIIRTQIFSGLFDRLGSLRISKLFSWIGLFLVPLIAGGGLYLIFTNLFTLLATPAAREVTRNLGLGAYLLLPGVNPFLPILYGWLAIVCAIVVHEGAHGIIARNRDLNVKSSGLIFLLVIPIGAFVDVDEEQIEEAEAKDSLRVMAGGVAANVAAALVCLLGILLLVNGLTPIIISGVYVNHVIEDTPAEAAGLEAQDVIISLNGMQITDDKDLKQALEGKQSGDTISITVARGEGWTQNFSTSLTLTESQEGDPVMGVYLSNINTEQVLAQYRQITPETLILYLVPPSFGAGQGLVPFSDRLAHFYTHSIGPQWQTYSNLLFWVWFVNINVAVFNALPIYPFDGGRMLNISLKNRLHKKMKEKNILRITYAVTTIILSVILMTVIIPYLPLG
ncbi:MAG: site-2 protease family protein [Thermoproteota archaeon]